MQKVNRGDTGMRVGLNALYLIPGGCGGLETFGTELIEALVALDSTTQYVVFTSRAAKNIFAPLREKLKVVVCPFDARNRIARYCWEQLVLPWLVLAYGVKVLHSLAYVGPILSIVPTILTIHDANSRVVGDTMSRTRRTFLWLVSRLAAQTADVVATVSEFSRGELARWYGLNAESISVILSGPGSQLLRDPDIDNPELEELISGEPYIAAIGGEYPHKNMSRLIRAFEKISASRPHRLIILGRLPDKCLAGVMSDRIVCTGYVSRNDLQEVIRRCDLFVMPSLYEGFGFPILEAQALGAPVACSRTASLVELADSSAALFDPENIDEIAAAIDRCIIDRAYNRELCSASRNNVIRFSWEHAAQAYELAYGTLGRRPASYWYRGIRCILKLARAGAAS